MEETLHQLSLVVHAIYLQGFINIPGGSLGFQPSAVELHTPRYQILAPELRFD